MSPTERIATALLGWQPFSKFGKNQPLPNLSTLDGCAEFERALRDKSMHVSFRKLGYMQALRREYQKVDQSAGESEACLYATPQQRVAACLRVLDEMEGK